MKNTEKFTYKAVVGTLDFLGKAVKEGGITVDTLLMDPRFNTKKNEKIMAKVNSSLDDAAAILKRISKEADEKIGLLLASGADPEEVVPDEEFGFWVNSSSTLMGLGEGLAKAEKILKEKLS